jgi:hypothetical protein
MKHKIKIHYIPTPSFKVNDERYYVQTIMLRGFWDVDVIIERELKRAEKLGHNIEMVIHSFTTVHDNKLVESIDGENVALFMRYRFFKSDGEHLPVPTTIE